MPTLHFHGAPIGSGQRECLVLRCGGLPGVHFYGRTHGRQFSGDRSGGERVAPGTPVQHGTNSLLPVQLHVIPFLQPTLDPGNMPPPIYCRPVCIALHERILFARPLLPKNPRVSKWLTPSSAMLHIGGAPCSAGGVHDSV